MKILLYGINFAPELTGVGKYTGEMAAWLAARGHEVRVVAAPPYYPEWKIGRGYSASRYTREDWCGVGVWRCPVWIPCNPGGARRILHLISFAFSSFPVMVRQTLWRPDVVWVVEPPLFCAPTAWLTARLCGARAWLHVQDFEVDAAFELGLLNGTFIRRLVAHWERRLMRRFDRVTTISQRMLERMRTKGVDDVYLGLFPNWVNLPGVDMDEARQALRVELGIDQDAVVALYSGTMGRKQGLSLLAKAAAQLLDMQDLVFVFCGNGAGRDELVSGCACLPNVRFLDLQPIERVAPLLAMADIHLLPQRADAADLVMPSKLTGMLASGRPVIATCASETELARVVQGRGIITPPEDADALVAAVRQLATDGDLRTRLGASARSYAEEFLASDVILAEFETGLEELVGSKEPVHLFGE